MNRLMRRRMEILAGLGGVALAASCSARAPQAGVTAPPRPTTGAVTSGPAPALAMSAGSGGAAPVEYAEEAATPEAEAPPAPALVSRDGAAAPPPAPSDGGDDAFSAAATAAAPGRPGVTPPPPPPAAPVRQPVPVIRALTAASVGDVDRRGPYLDYLSRHPAERAQIGLDMTRRVRFRVLDAQSRPIHDAEISFSGANHTVEGRTHADGYWDFFPGVSAPDASGEVPVIIRYRNARVTTKVVIPAQGDAPDVVVQMPQAASVMPANLDLAFLIDVTGSMGDELAYVAQEIQGIVQRARQAAPQVNVRVAATFYRDRADLRPLEQLPFTTDIGAFQGQMRAIRAGGGGDYPEDLNRGIEAAMSSLEWSTNPAVRVLVVISDAPPQPYPDAQYTYRHAMIDASRRGIRILPVAASGADRVVEYLFRAMGAFTSTPYVYLTDDSGIGGHHMEADTDRISVEMFSDLLTRLLIAELRGEGMHEPSHAVQGQLVPGQM